MRAGRLNTPATLLELGAELQCIEHDWLWCGIQTKESAEPPFPTGLRNPAKVSIRAWYDERLRQGRYLLADGRLFHIDSARDYTGARAEVAIIEVGRPQVDDQLFIGGALYNIVAYARDTDDGVVRGLWLELA